MTAVIVRIGLRYGVGYLVIHNLLTQEDAASLAVDPDVQMAIGIALGAVVEGWYVLARRFGWSK